jgi:hypothetical protein
MQDFHKNKKIKGDGKVIIEQQELIKNQIADS